jgi:hypothetical protein
MKGYTRKLVATIIMIVLLLTVSSVLFAERVVSSQTLVIHAYIPPRTTVSFTEYGELLFTSNSPNAILSVVELSDATLLSVVAR